MERAEQPTGTVTFLFTDIEGSTRAWERDAEAMERTLAHHDAVVRDTIEAHGGYVFKTVGDAFCAAFSRPAEAVSAAVDSQRQIEGSNGGSENGLHVRIALHTGQAEVRDGDYFGRDVNRVARLLSIGHGGQVLVSGTTRGLLDDQALGAATLRDLGRHVLKDIDQPEHVFQVDIPHLRSDFPPLHSASWQNNLPRRLTHFIGREEEIAKVDTLIQRHRLVTLTGSGGTGKTRLATETAFGALERFPDGVWFLGLGNLSDPDRVTPALAAMLGVREVVRRPLLEVVADYLHDKRTLLVLDNCEHMTEACGSVVEMLLGSAPDLRILTTSRECLGVEGEQVWSVPLLDENESVRLFADRARLVNEAFVVDENNAASVARVCARLDGIPLALELAAARTAVLSPAEIADRVDDRFQLLRGGAGGEGARHETLKATIDWSYDLLEPDEQALFERLSVFSGGWMLDAAEAVAPEEVDVLDALQALVAKSLVVVERNDGASRYRMLETTREYAVAKLATTPELESTRSRHLEWCADFTDRADSGLTGKDSAAWMKRLEAESPNLLAALDWSAERGVVDEAVRIIGTIWRYWLRSGALSEGIGWAERTVVSHKGGAPRDRGRALYGLSTLLFFRGEMMRSRAVAIQALGLGTQHNDPLVTTRAHAALGRINLAQGDLDEAIEHHQAALDIARDFDEEWAHTAVSLLLGNLAEAFRARGELERARDLYREALDLCEEKGFITTEDMHRFNLGQAELALSETAAAEKAYRRALTLGVELGKRLTPMYGIVGLAQIAAVRGDARRAALLFGAADALRKSMGTVLEDVDREIHDEHTRIARDALGYEAYAVTFEEGRALDLERATELALDQATLDPARFT